MSDQVQKMTFNVTSRRVDPHGSRSYCKDAEIVLDTDMNGRVDGRFLKPSATLLMS